jgi:hypothetical protein
MSYKIISLCTNLRLQRSCHFIITRCRSIFEQFFKNCIGNLHVLVTLAHFYNSKTHTSFVLFDLGSRRTILIPLTPSPELLPASCTVNSTVDPSLPRKQACSCDMLFGQGDPSIWRITSWGCRIDRAGNPSCTCKRGLHQCMQSRVSGCPKAP